MGMKTGRNDLCPCGSGKKYKYCCGKSDQRKSFKGSALTENKEKCIMFNENRNSEDVEVFDRYVSNPAYQEKFIRRYLDLQKFPKTRKKMDELYSEVCRYADGRRPDYSGYRDFLYKKYLDSTVENDNVYAGYLFFDPNNTGVNLEQESFGIILFPLIYAYKTEELNNYECLNEHSSQQELNDAAVAYNAWKIMTSVLREELGFILDIMMNTCDEDDLKHLDDNLDKLNTRGLVARFFETVSKREKEISFKILGKINDLDPGEAEYMEAVAYFYDQNYERTIYYGSKVSKSNIDYGKTISLILESYAILGEFKEMCELIEANRDLSFRPLQILYLIQETVLNAHDYEAVADELGYFNPKIISEENGDEFYEKIALNTCKSIVRLIRLINETIVYSEINIEQQKKNNEFSRNLLALHCVVDYFEPVGMKDFLDIIKNKTDTYDQNEWLDNILDIGFKCIARICIDCNPIQSMGLVLFTFQCQYDIGMKKEFIQNVNSNIEALTMYAGKEGQDEKCRNLLLLAYTEETISGEINETLAEYIKVNCPNDINRKTIIQKTLERKLSRNARIALEAAELMFSMSKDIDWGWRDAGMLSLGFFRIIEVEINDKLVLPLIKDEGIKELKYNYELRRNVLNGDAKHTYSERWGRIVKALEKISEGNSDVNGLMLGELELFFQNIGSLFDVDDNLASFVRNRISGLVDSDIVLDELIAMIEDEITKREIRDKYRNPPAHTKYLPYEIACECRERFYEVMMEFERALK